MAKTQKYFIHTFGCQANKSDSEKIAAVLEKLKYKPAKKFVSADLIIINTCSVRQSAEDRALWLLAKLEKIKEKNRKLTIGITGCMANLNPEKLQKKADFIFDVQKLDDLIKKITTLKKQINKKPTNYKINYFKILPKYSSSYHAFIPIMSGCNNFCSYCVVPYARGREISRSPKEIIKEIKNLLKQGYKAITLVGQNVNSYGKDLKEKMNFSQLLKKIEKIPGNFWIWFVTSHPKDMSDELIETVAQSKKICPYIHLPLQAGSNKILTAMNRGYTKEKYLNLVKKIKNKIKNCTISTDIIVGFPTETKKDFQETCQLFQKIKFDMAYIAEYSKRPKTQAAKLDDNVPLPEKIKRKKILDKILRKIAKTKNQKLIGKTVEVLIEKEKNEKLFAKTKTFKTVIIDSLCNKKNLPKLIGQIVKVRITKAYDFGLEGKLISNC